MKTEKTIKVVEFKTTTDLQLSVQRITPYSNGNPYMDEICFLISGYSVEDDCNIEYSSLIPISEAKRMIGVLELMTMNENEHFGINPDTNKK